MGWMGNHLAGRKCINWLAKELQTINKVKPEIHIFIIYFKVLLFKRILCMRDMIKSKLIYKWGPNAQVFMFILTTFHLYCSSLDILQINNSLGINNVTCLHEKLSLPLFLLYLLPSLFRYITDLSVSFPLSSFLLAPSYFIFSFCWILMYMSFWKIH